MTVRPPADLGVVRVDDSRSGHLGMCTSRVLSCLRTSSARSAEKLPPRRARFRRSKTLAQVHIAFTLSRRRPVCCALTAVHTDSTLSAACSAAAQAASPRARSPSWAGGAPAARNL